ncbi:hypothetical protein M758_UG265700 [Ceratodon purpureus]|nr:hypothetical protein M758_UG265700 [Ceratodon purpureus]
MNRVCGQSVSGRNHLVKTQSKGAAAGRETCMAIESSSELRRISKQCTSVGIRDNIIFGLKSRSLKSSTTE